MIVKDINNYKPEFPHKQIAAELLEDFRKN